MCVHTSIYMNVYQGEATQKKLEVCRRNEGVSTSVAGTSNSFSSGVECGFSILNFSGNYCVLRVAMVEKD